MSRYLARIVQRDGNATYLVRGKLTDWQRGATHYPHPSNAHQAIARFLNARKLRTGDVYFDVIDTRDPERGSL